MMGWETEHMPSLHPASQSMQSDKKKKLWGQVSPTIGFSQNVCLAGESSGLSAHGWICNIIAVTD